MKKKITLLLLATLFVWTPLWADERDTLRTVQMDELVIVAAIISGPNCSLVLLIEAAQFFRVIDDHGFFFGVQINQHHQPVISEHLEIIEDHLFTHFLNVLLVNQ